ncbi:MAG TPA: hypothetical protein VIH40_06475 [Xanthobacteraceae bacterium]
MTRYRVDTIVVKFGPGQQLVLAPAQIARRRHCLNVPAGYSGEAASLVTARAAIEFKRGEVIGLAALDKPLIGMLVPVAVVRDQRSEGRGSKIRHPTSDI